MNSLYCDTLFTDLTIACKDQTFNVHKVVVCTQSSVLRQYAMDTANVCCLFGRMFRERGIVTWSSLQMESW